MCLLCWVHIQPLNTVLTGHGTTRLARSERWTEKHRDAVHDQMRLTWLSGNAILKRCLIETVSRCSLITAVHQPPGNAACEHDEHERIVDCIARGDANQAAALMDQHLCDLERHLTLERPAAQRDLAYLLGLF
jgi:DNA-binding GntR family transcriptional regulator